MMDGKTTFELTKSTKDQRINILQCLGTEAARFEKLDANTFNLTVPDEYADAARDLLEEEEIEHRMV